jgi:hypothetical protein
MADIHSILCPNCKKNTNLISRSSYAWPKAAYVAYEIGECNSCDYFMLIQRTRGLITRILPTPLPKSVDERIPEPIKTDFTEAYLCLSVGAYRGAAVMGRRALQNICLEKGAKEGASLQTQIDWLFSEGIITKELKDWAHEVRYVGNDAAHPNKQLVTQNDAEDIINLLEQFADVLYIAPHIAAERRKIRQQTTNA